MMGASNAASAVLLAVDSIDRAVVSSLTDLTGWQVSVVMPRDDVVGAYRDASPSVLVIDAGAFEAHREQLFAVRRRPVICVGPDDPVAIHAAMDAGAMGWVSTPLTAANLATAVEVALRWFEQVEALTAEKQLLAQTLETRKLVERAKSIFMRRLKLDEATAHKRLQQESQNRRIGLAELARKIIESEELLTHQDEGATLKSG